MRWSFFLLFLFLLVIFSISSFNYIYAAPGDACSGLNEACYPGYCNTFTGCVDNCGDRTCDNEGDTGLDYGETSSTCCTDCGCSSGECINNRCVSTCGDRTCQADEEIGDCFKGTIDDCDQDGDGFRDSCAIGAGGSDCSNHDKNDECPGSSGSHDGCQCNVDPDCSADVCTATGDLRDYFCNNRYCRSNIVDCPGNICYNAECMEACTELTTCTNPCMGGCNSNNIASCTVDRIQQSTITCSIPCTDNDNTDCSVPVSTSQIGVCSSGSCSALECVYHCGHS